MRPGGVHATCFPRLFSGDGQASALAAGGRFSPIFPLFSASELPRPPFLGAHKIRPDGGLARARVGTCENSGRGMCPKPETCPV